MTAKNFAKNVPAPVVLSNGNADFWSAHPAADCIGGAVTDTETGIFIEGGDLYNFENISLDKADIRIERIVDEEGAYFTVTAHEVGTGEELLHDDSADTLTEAFDVLADYAPVPQFLEEWNASDVSHLGDPAEYFNNCMVITNFKWIDEKRGIAMVGQLAIYAHRYPLADATSTSPDFFFSVYHTANGMGAVVIDLQFTDFNELLETVKQHSELNEVLSAAR